jgi:delta14-sterol reductase
MCCAQARYLVDHDPHLSLPAIVAIAAVYFLGYFIFRSSNSQKDAFRRDPTAPEVRCALQRIALHCDT